MTQEDKELLLVELYARLPYGIKCKDQYGEYIDVNIYNAHLEHLVDQIVSGVVQMVLRPMSSMTEDERKEYERFSHFNIGFAPILMDWVYSHHLDCCGLIEKGVALVAPERMYKL